MASKISYAQQGEDIVLWRALGGLATGTYIDVGAHHPVGSSVTKIFYDAGWRGVNIEPIASMMPLFVEDRPRDVNLAVGISDVAGEMVFYDVVDDQQRSTFSVEFAEMYRRDGYNVVEHVIPVIRLDQLYAEHITGDVDFLKIDAEGHEEAVLRSLDLTQHRPRVVLAEGATAAAEVWIPLLTGAGYRRSLFDGLNHFFVAEEHWDELSGPMSYPACSLDDFETYDHLLVLNQLRAENEALRAENEALRQRAEHAARAAERSMQQRVAARIRRWRQR